MPTEPPFSKSTAADEIRNLLTKKGWTQGRLAEELRVTQPTVSRWLSGKQDPNHEQTLRIYNLIFKATGEDSPDNISDNIALLGYVDSNMKVIIANNDQIYKAKLAYGMSCANLTGFIIASNTATPLGQRDWIVLCSPGYSVPLKEGRYYLVTLPDRSVYLRQIHFGNEPGTFHLSAPGLEPVFNATVALAMTVIGVIMPDTLEVPIRVDVSAYESA